MIESAFMSESLARGLTSRFFNEMIELGNRLGSKLNSKKPRIINRNSHLKYISLVKKDLADALILDYEGGSNSHPYYALDLISAFKDREFNTWKEKCVSGSTMLFSFSPRYFDWTPSPYTLGEHAIYRLFCRTKPLMGKNGINSKYIIRQLEYLPLWSNFWIKQCYFDENSNLDITPVLPAPNGLFLGRANHSDLLFEIRTFIGDSQLSENQYEAKSELLKIGKPYLKSPLSFATPIMATGIDYVYAIQLGLCHDLSHSSKLGAIKNELFKNIENDSMRSSAKNIFELKLNEHRNFFSSKLVQNLKKDIRGSLKEWKVGIYKNLADHPTTSDHIIK